MLILGFLVFQIFPDKLLAMFNASKTCWQSAIPALRIIKHKLYCLPDSVSLLGSVFQALETLFYSLVVSWQTVSVLLPAAYLLSIT